MSDLEGPLLPTSACTPAPPSGRLVRIATTVTALMLGSGVAAVAAAFAGWHHVETGAVLVLVTSVLVLAAMGRAANTGSHESLQ